MSSIPIDHHHPHAAFTHRDFRLFYTARMSNNLGTNVMMPALGWQIYAMTRDPFALGLIGLAVFVPVLAMTLPSGQMADRFERRGVYRGFQLGLVLAAALFCLLTLVGTTNPLPFYLAAGVFGASKTFSAPSANAWMPHLVPRDIFPSAVAWTQSAFQIASVVGPAIAGLTLYLWGAAATYALAAMLFGGSFLFATLVRTRSQGQDRSKLGIAHLFGGLSYIYRSRLILGATTLDVFAVLMGGATAMLPVYAHDVLHVDEAGFGILRSAPALGGAAMALLLAHRPLRRHVGRWMFAAVIAFGVTTIMFGLSRSLVISGVALVLLGASDMVGAFIRGTLVQLSTHDDMRGRVSSVNMVFASAKNELGDVQSGFLASAFGVVPAVVFGGVCTLGIAAIWAWRFPELRRVDRLAAATPTSLPNDSV